MTQNINDTLLRISALLILLSAVLYLVIPTVAPWIMAFSVALFAVRTVASPYPGKSIRFAEFKATGYKGHEVKPEQSHQEPVDTSDDYQYQR